MRWLTPGGYNLPTWLRSLLLRLRRLGGWRRSALLILGDILITTFSFYLAFLVRFEGHVPVERIAQYWRYLPVLLTLRVVINTGFRLDRWSFRLSGLHEALRIAQASLLGSALFTAILFFVQRAAENVSLGPPRSVIVIELLLTTALVTASRFSLRVAGAWGVNVFRPRVGERVRTVIVGAGSAGELLLRDLQRSAWGSWTTLRRSGGR
jgi:FlaA1/EpsC-like NDP-sugar epimerase